MDVFAPGLAMGESPRWHHGWLWLCDWMAAETPSLDEPGGCRVELSMSAA